MRIGVLTRPEPTEWDWIAEAGFRSIEWVAFADGPCGPKHADWKPSADAIAHAARSRGIRISAIGALYGNPLDPKQTHWSTSVFRRAFEVASYLGIKTVAGFPGAVIETEWNERGGNPVYRPFENFLPRLVAFWEPLAECAKDQGVRIAFEHCPQGAYHLPIMGYNMLAQPAMWERFFDATRCENLGIEWDASHLICQLIDPVETIHKFGARIFHVHAKDAYVHEALLRRYGICHPGVAEHRMPGLGQANWAEIVHALLRTGYDSDLNIEGWHDPVYRDYPNSPNSAFPAQMAGVKLERTGLLIAKQTLERYVCGTDRA